MRDVLLLNKVNYWTGTACREFEKEFAAWTGAGHAVPLANGTLALDVALKALGIGGGALVGMGAVVTKSVAPGATVVGNPARLMER